MINEKNLAEYLQKISIEPEIENVDTLTKEEFADIRHNWFGASDSSKLLNVNPFERGSREDLINDKINNFHDESIGEKASVRCGSDLEPMILEKASKYLGANVYKPTTMYVNRETGQATNFDGVTVDGDKYVPVEAKYCSMWGGKHYKFENAFCETHYVEGFLAQPDVYFDENYSERIIEEYTRTRAETCGIPVYYYTQLQQQIDFLNSDYGYLVVQNQKDWRFYIFKIKRDDFLIEKLREAAKLSYVIVGLKKGFIEPDTSEEAI